MSKFNDCFGFIEILAGKQLKRGSSESALRRNEDFAGILPPPSQIKQGEKYPRRTDP